MTYILRDLDWFDLEGHEAFLEELRALPPSDLRDRQVEGQERHLASIRPFFGTPENSPESGASGPLAPETP